MKVRHKAILSALALMLVAAWAIPNLMSFRVTSETETYRLDAIHQLRLIRSSQRLFLARNQRYGTLSELTQANLLPAQLSSIAEFEVQLFNSKRQYAVKAYKRTSGSPRYFLALNGSIYRGIDESVDYDDLRKLKPDVGARVVLVRK